MYESIFYMKVSIVVPVYNRIDYLEDCIRSIEAQNYDDIEIICVDDGSSDGSYDKLLELQSASRFRKGSGDDPGDFLVLRHEEKQEVPDDEYRTMDYVYVPTNKGTQHALNTGFNAASGDLIGIVDSDDMLAPFTVAPLVKFFKRNPGLDFAWTLYEAIEQNGSWPRLGARCKWPAPKNQKEVIIQNLIRFSCFHFKMVRTSSYRNKFATWENMPSISVDYAWILENMFRGEFRRFEHVGYYYRTKSDNSHSTVRKQEQMSVSNQVRSNCLAFAHQNGYISDEELADIKERCKQLKENHERKKIKEKEFNSKYNIDNSKYGPAYE